MKWSTLAILAFGLLAVDGSQALTAEPKSETEGAKEAIEKGVAAFRKGDLDKSIAAFTEAIRLNPSDPDAYRKRGVAYAEKGELDKGIRDFTDAIRLNPEYVEAYYNRGVTYGRKNGFDEALRDLTEAIRLKPKYFMAYDNRGSSMRRRVNSTRRWPTSWRPLGWARSMPSRTTTGTWSTIRSVSTPKPSLTSPKRSGSIRSMRRRIAGEVLPTGR